MLQDLDDCLLLVDRTLAETQETAEYALYIKALIHRQKGFNSLLVSCRDQLPISIK